MEPATGLTILGGAIGSAKLLEKLLGPSADYLGNQLKEWTQKRCENTKAIFENASKKIGEGMDTPGSVAPKVLKSVLEEGGWCEESLQVEYFGGILASSRTNVSRDDRGAYFSSLSSRLSTYQLRTHYLIYSALRDALKETDKNIYEDSGRRRMAIYIPYSSYFNAMEYSKEEIECSWNLMSHSIWGLSKEDLITNFKYGNAELMKSEYPDASDSGIWIIPSSLGAELFLWAFGHGKLDSNSLFKSSVEIDLPQDIPSIEAIPTKP